MSHGKRSKRAGEFSLAVQKAAIARQKNRCASCGTAISRLGEEGRKDHFYGEAANAHHVRHIKRGGSASIDNCAIVCESCHYSAHEGGNYRFGTVMGTSSDFPCFK